MTQRERFIQDNLNNRVALSNLEFQLIRTPTFARLSRLSQLGLGHQVYPGASHTRAAHSIGVMHTVGKACEALRLDDDETDLLRVAGLLHDIGQYPLSHCVELVYRAIGTGQAPAQFLFGAQQGQSAAQGLLRRITTTPPKADQATDKAIGEHIVRTDEGIQAVLEENGMGGEASERIANLVAGQGTVLLHTQLLNSDYDCDRLDYVRRDSLATGVGYGSFSVDFLLEHVNEVFYPPNSDERTLVFDADRSLVALEQYLLARYGMYSQVYYHKTVRSLELMARAVVLGLAESGVVYATHGNIREVVGTTAYLSFDDSYFWRHAALAAESTDFSEELRQLARRVLCREPLKLAYQYRTVTRPGDDAPYTILSRLAAYGDDLEKVCREVRIDPACVVVDKVPPIDFVPGSEGVPPERLQSLLYEAQAAEEPQQVLSDEFAKLRKAPMVRDRGGSTGLLTGDPGSLIGQFAGKRVQIIRFYLTEGSDDDAERLRQALKQHGRGA